MREMANPSEFQPQWACPPGTTIGRLLTSYELLPIDFADKVGLSLSGATRLLNGSLDLSEDLAVRLADVIGGSPRFWLEREKRYREHAARLESEKPLAAEWLRSLPLSDMKRFGWLPGSTKRTELYSDCLDFFDVSSLSEWEARYSPVIDETTFRNSTSIESKRGSIASWLRRGEILAEEVICQPWNSPKFLDTLRGLRKLTRTRNPETFLPQLREACSDCGVALVIAQGPRGCPASGATRFLTPRKALLLLSFRFLTDDHFWFSFFHEAGHLVLHGDKTIIEAKSEEPVALRLEAEANRFAEEILIPSSGSPLSHVQVTKPAIREFARQLGIAPGIVVGQMQYKGYLSHRNMNHLKTRYMWTPTILESES